MAWGGKFLLGVVGQRIWHQLWYGSAVFRLIKKIVTYLLVLAAAIALVATGYLYFNQDRMIFPAPAGDGPAILNDGLENVSIKTSDGETITGLYHPPEAEETTVLVFH